VVGIPTRTHALTNTATTREESTGTSECLAKNMSQQIRQRNLPKRGTA